MSPDQPAANRRTDPRSARCSWRTSPRPLIAAATDAASPGSRTASTTRAPMRASSRAVTCPGPGPGPHQVARRRRSRRAEAAGIGDPSAGCRRETAAAMSAAVAAVSSRPVGTATRARARTAGHRGAPARPARWSREMRVRTPAAATSGGTSRPPGRAATPATGSDPRRRRLTAAPGPRGPRSAAAARPRRAPVDGAPGGSGPRPVPGPADILAP